jgi:hypothetical protein
MRSQNRFSHLVWLKVYHHYRWRYFYILFLGAKYIGYLPNRKKSLCIPWFVQKEKAKGYCKEVEGVENFA